MMSEQTDMLIAHSTVPGCVSLRNPENGSWFIQDFCKVYIVIIQSKEHDIGLKLKS